MTTLNYWHFITFGVIFLIFIAGTIGAMKQDEAKVKVGMFISVAVMCLFLAGFSVIVVDKYTKVVKLHKLKNKRLLSTEQIVYTGIVRNEGKHKIGVVTFELKLVNRGHATGNVKGGNFYKASGFFDFFTSGFNKVSKPQSVTKEFVVATNLKPGTSQSFRVYFRYPPYFRSTAQFAKVWGH
ncbi:DUF2393 family protein [Sulfurimonas sp. SAG-AH-194-C20]|nr:DUF2393 family protein [Sulfurimonas sp. SAG-AH-194-C20]MDF1878788.1 DUF2393 family protein [Sulfurimonas sp. SAG-AH-194-C20]